MGAVHPMVLPRNTLFDPMRIPDSWPTRGVGVLTMDVGVLYRAVAVTADRTTAAADMDADGGEVGVANSGAIGIGVVHPGVRDGERTFASFGISIDAAVDLGPSDRHVVREDPQIAVYDLRVNHEIVLLDEAIAGVLAQSYPGRHTRCLG